MNFDLDLYKKSNATSSIVPQGVVKAFLLFPYCLF